MSTIRINNPQSRKFRYDVAFSFAEEDRAFVDRVAVYLKQGNVRFYYDNDKRVESWGKDLSVYLGEVYRTDARFCVMFVSRHYRFKRWSTHERKHAQARAFFMDNREYILPFRLDDAEIPELEDTIAYLSSETYDEKRLAQAIIDKIKESKPKPTLHLIWHKCFIQNRQTAAAIFLVFFTLSILDIYVYQLSGRSTLTARLLQQLNLRNKWHFSAVCADGTLSQYSSSGACSHHDGVGDRIDTVLYGQNLETLKKTLIHK
jgi:hypothetical protein